MPPDDPTNAAAIVFLVDESTEMGAPIAGGTKSKAESVATAVNSMLNQLAAGPLVHVAIVGYGATDDGQPTAQLRWRGSLASHSLVESSQLAAAPLTVEQRVRRIPGPGGIGVASEETIEFPIWYVPERLTPGNFAQAAAFIQNLLVEHAPDASGSPPLVLHVTGAMPPAAALQDTATLSGALWCHLHLSPFGNTPATLYPSSAQHLSGEDATALFDASRELPRPLADSLRAAKLPLAPAARGFVCQAAMGDLIRFVSLAKAYATAPPSAFALSAPAEQTIAPDATIAMPAPTPAVPTEAHAPFTASGTYDRAAVVFLLDRSQADPASGAWQRREQQANELIGQIAQRAGGDVDVGLVLHGPGGVESGFAGPLQGQTLVPDTELTDSPLRVEEYTEKVSNGIGGLIEVKRSRPIYVECEPSGPAADLTAAIDALGQLLKPIRDDQTVLPIVMHITGTDLPPETITGGGATLAELGDVLLYHAIVSERPQRTLAYPAESEQIEDPATRAIWRITSPLAGAEQMTEQHRPVTPQSRGLVAAAKFDLLIESLRTVLTTNS